MTIVDYDVDKKTVGSQNNFDLFSLNDSSCNCGAPPESSLYNIETMKDLLKVGNDTPKVTDED